MSKTILRNFSIEKVIDAMVKILAEQEGVAEIKYSIEKKAEDKTA